MLVGEGNKVLMVKLDTNNAIQYPPCSHRTSAKDPILLKMRRTFVMTYNRVGCLTDVLNC